MSTEIHPTAVVAPSAIIGEGSRIGPLCYVGPDVVLGRHNILQSHVVLDGRLEMGDHNVLYSFACLGKQAQDLKFRQEYVVGTKIGSHNTFREYATVNGAAIDGHSTVIGNHCLLLSYSHVAHDCVLGDHVILSSDSKLAGHVSIGDHAVINGKTGVVQFVRIGKFAYVGGLNKVAMDILPFCIADGIPSRIRAVNKIGLERNGFPPETIAAVRDAFRLIFRSKMRLDEAVRELNEKYPDVPAVQEMITFAVESKVGLARPRVRDEKES